MAIHQDDKYQSALRQYQWMLQQSQAGLNPLGGSIGQSGFGPAGLLIRSGLGQISAESLKLLPEETAVEALVGWRRWSVPMFGSVILSNNGTEWKPYEALVASCSLKSGCQGIRCGCGLYAYKSREQAESLDNRPTEVTHVWGQVMLWGRVIEHTKGLRAQFAYPKALVDTGGIARQIAAAYGVKVIK